MTAQQFLAAIEDGTLTAEAQDTELTLTALAEASGCDVYPDTEIDIKIDDVIVATIGVWKMAVYMEGPNRRDTGEYIGNGWSLIVGDSDGQTHGSVTVRVDEGQVNVITGEGMSGDFSIDCDSEEDAELIAEVLGDLINEAYASIDIVDASDEDIVTALRDLEPLRDLCVDCGDDSISVDIHGGFHAGRPYWAVGEEDDVLYDSADSATDGAVLALKSRLEKADESINDIDLARVVESIEMNDE